jgi:hypothetical protein
MAHQHSSTGHEDGNRQAGPDPGVRPHFDARRIPAKLIPHRQWVVWKYQQRKGKQTKVPFNPLTGDMGDTSDPKTWGSLPDAIMAFEAGGFDGIGFVFANGFCGVDLDKCRNPITGQIDPAALDTIRAIDSYTESSPSATGLHILAIGKLPDKGINKTVAGRKIEMYDQGRFFTFTGKHIEGTPFDINDRQQEVVSLYNWTQKTHKEEREEKRKAKSQARNKSENKRAEQPPRDSSESGFKSPPMADAEVMEKAMNAGNGEKFTRVWFGDISDYADEIHPEGNPSRADEGLCSMIAFWTQEWEQIERLWLASKLNREKLGREDYRQRTIQFALDNLTDRYDPAKYKQPETASDSGAGRLQIICKMFAELNISDEVFRSYIATRTLANGRKYFKMGGLDLARNLRKTYNDDETERRFGSDRIRQMREEFESIYPFLRVHLKGGGINRDGSPGPRTVWLLDETPFIEAEKKAQELIDDYLPAWQVRYPDKPELARKIALWYAREHASIHIAQRFRPANDEIPPIPEISDPVQKLYSRETKIKNRIIEDMKRLVGVWQDMDLTRGEMVQFKKQLDGALESEFLSGLDPEFRRKRQKAKTSKKQPPTNDFSIANTSNEKGNPRYRRRPVSYDESQPKNDANAPPHLQCGYKTCGSEKLCIGS